MDAKTTVIETDVVAVQENDEGVPSRVNDYAVLAMLGEGSFSKVYHCQNGKGDEYLGTARSWSVSLASVMQALKILKKSFLKRKREFKKVEGKMVFCNALDKVQREVAIMKKLSHTNLVKLHEIIDSPADDKMFLVLELIQGGQVMHWDDKAFRYRAANTPNEVIPKEDARNCMRDVVMALSYLHRHHICHRDIKPENILLTNSQIYKLADFGVAHMLDDENKTTLRSTEGTYHFLAPECTTGEEYDPFQVDIWALGVTLYAMLQGTLPFGTKAASLTQVMDSIREDPLRFGSDVAPDCVEVLLLMLEKDPKKRICIQELKDHPWIMTGSEQARFSRSHSLVQVTQQEIEAAFTPVNNFILMTKLKLKMSSRLARARKSVESRQHAFEGVTSSTDALHTLWVDTTGTAALSPTLGTQDGGTTPRPEGDGTTLPQSESAPPSPPHLSTYRHTDVNRRKSSMSQSMRDELDALLSATTAVLDHTADPRSLSDGGVAITPLSDESLPHMQVASFDVSALSVDVGVGKRLELLGSFSAPTSPTNRMSRKMSANPSVQDTSAANELRLPRLELPVPLSSSPTQSPATGSATKDRRLDSVSRPSLGSRCSSKSDGAGHRMPSPERHCCDPVDRGAAAHPVASQPTTSASTPRDPAHSSGSQTTPQSHSLDASRSKDGGLPAPEPSVMLQPRKSGLSSLHTGLYAQTLADAGGPSGENDCGGSEKAPKIFQTRKSNISLANGDRNDNSSTFSRTTVAGSGGSSPKRKDGPTSVSQQQHPEGMFANLEDESSIASGSAGNPRRSKLVHLFSKRRLKLETQGSLQRLVQRKSQVVLKESKSSSAYESIDEVEITAANTEINAASASTSPSTLAHVHTRKPSVVSGLTATALIHSTSQLLHGTTDKSIATLRTQKTEVCTVM